LRYRIFPLPFAYVALSGYPEERIETPRKYISLLVETSCVIFWGGEQFLFVDFPTADKLWHWPENKTGGRSLATL
jgi:hypothetical protein